VLPATVIDPVAVPKHLDDGFYGQRLSNTQIAALDDQCFPVVHTNRDAQYPAIMAPGSSSSTLSASSSTALVTSVQSEGEVLSQSEGSTTLVGTRIQSNGGVVTVQAGQDVNLEAARNTSETSESHQRSKNNFVTLTRTKSSETTTQSSDTAQVVNLSGLGVSVVAAQDAKLEGTRIDSSQGSAIVLAGRDLTAAAAHDTSIQTNSFEKSSTAQGVSVTSA
jgi:hypothetical protein